MSEHTLETRKCIDCNNEYPLTEEYFRNHWDNRQNKGYFQRRCIFCARVIDHQNYARIDGATKMREWRQNNPEKYVEAKARYKDRHPDKVKAIKQRERTKNNEGYLRRGREWRQRNLEKSRAHGRKMYYQAKSRKPGYIRASNERRLVRKTNAQGRHTAMDVDLLYKEQDGHCGYCGIAVYWNIPYDVHVDHMIPLVQDGSNSPENLVIACSGCNLSKNSKTPEEWKEVRGW